MQDTFRDKLVKLLGDQKKVKEKLDELNKENAKLTEKLDKIKRGEAAAEDPRSPTPRTSPRPRRRARS